MYEKTSLSWKTIKTWKKNTLGTDVLMKIYEGTILKF